MAGVPVPNPRVRGRPARRCRRRRRRSRWGHRRGLVTCFVRATQTPALRTLGSAEMRAAAVTRREGPAGVVCGAGSCRGGRAWAGEAQQCHKGVTAMWPWSCFWVGLLTWEGETGRTPPISTLVWRANSVAHTNVEMSRNSSPEFHQLDEIWRNYGCLLERHRRLKSAMKRGGSLERPLSGEIPTSTNSRLYLKSRGKIDVLKERGLGRLT